MKSEIEEYYVILKLNSVEICKIILAYKTKYYIFQQCLIHLMNRYVHHIILKFDFT